MSARSSLYGILLALVLMVSGCSQDDLVNTTIEELGTLTDDIVTTIDESEDKQAGVAEAQKQLDAKQADLAAKMEKIKALRGFQVEEETMVKFADGLIAMTLEMATLEARMLALSATDPELKAAVDKLVTDHEALISLE